VALAFQVPPQASYTEASNHKISTYQSLDGSNVQALKNCLAQGFPFVFGFTVFSSFESASVASNGIVPMPSSYEEEQGGHAVMCVGYDDAKQVFIVRNSWGPDWGDNGYFYLSYTYLTNPELANDFWTLRR
jgi:C1A family cysteine protease